MLKKIILLLFIAIGLHADNIGQKLDHFTLPYLDKQGSIDGTSLKGNVLLINFWASWCGSCKREMPLLEKLAKKYEGKGCKVIPINLDRKKAFALKYLEGLKQEVGSILSMIMLYDKEKGLFKKHPSRGYPYTLLVDKKGTIIQDYLGSFTEQSIVKLEKKINDLLR